MEKLNEAQKIKIGTKFDQPGFGLKGLDGKPAGFDVEIAKIIAAELGIAGRQDRVHRDAVDGPRAGHRAGQGRHRRRHVHDQRQAQAADRLRRAVLRGRPAHHGAQPTTTRITGPDSFKAGDKKVCSVTDSTPAEQHQEVPGQRGAAAGALRHLPEVRRRPERQAGRRGHHRQRDPARLHRRATRASSSWPATSSPRSRTASALKKDDTAFRDWINDVLEKAYERRPVREGVGRHRRQVRREPPPAPAGQPVLTYH